ncbi:site-2 protease family protein [Haloarculaceae archaeon H-GB2-1]|nr:site-2 protease family protein [Haloarculaceae archaeon H-GB1-1]MEA5386066.1 site-2 protease family protein [Haloarculaceae archaeon H-GB11]MEA5407573.1 site-2 protease family protein [Haloarculaceae archaeon H-GB2-1]
MTAGVVVILGVLWGYLGLMHLADRRGLLPDWIRVSGVFVSFRTKRGKRVLGRLATSKRFWRLWAGSGLVLALLSLVGTFVGGVWLATHGLTLPGSFEHTAFSPATPMPLVVPVVFITSTVIHEMGHGVLCKVEDIEITAVGQSFIAFVPTSAFVEQDGDSREAASYTARMRMFAAGVTNNFALAGLGIVVLIPLVASFTVVPGVAVGGVVAGSPADQASIERGDVIVAVDGAAVSGTEEFQSALAASDGQTRVTVADGETHVVSPGSSESASLGVQPYAAGTHLAALRSGSVVDRTAYLLQAPVVSLTTDAYAFSFVGFDADFYRTAGPLSGLGTLPFVLASLAFWTVWVNVVFAVLNCIPSIPLDGGHLLRASSGVVAETVGVENVRGFMVVATLAGSLVTLATFGVGLIGIG